MKNSLFHAIALTLNIVLATAGSLQAQRIQTFTIHELNSNKRPVPGVQVLYSDASAAVSDPSGNLSLEFQNKKSGDWVFLTDVEKDGYELVNKKEIEQLRLGSNNRYVVEIILAKAGKIDLAKKEYYEHLDDALLASFGRERERLLAELSAGTTSKQAFDQQFKQLQAQYDAQKETLESLADKLARINADDANPESLEALQLFKAGKVEKAIAKLESAQPANRAAQAMKDEKRYGALPSQADSLAKNKRRQLASVSLLADMYSLEFNPARAEEQFDALIQLDSSDLTILQAAADFYRLNHRYEKAIQVLDRITAHPLAEGWQKSEAYLQMGTMYTELGDLSLALKAQRQGEKICFGLWESHKTSYYYKYNLARAHNELGKVERSLGHLPAALGYFERFYQSLKTLYADYPQLPYIKQGLAIAYDELARTKVKLGELESALEDYEHFASLIKELHEAYPQDLSYKDGLASSFAGLGETYTLLGNTDKALRYFLVSNQLGKEIYEAFPQKIDYKNYWAISNLKLGETYNALGNADSALWYFEQYNRLEKELHQTYPKNAEFKKSLAISYQFLGIIHSSAGDLDAALRCFEQFNQLGKELYADFPQNVFYKQILATSYIRLGDPYIVQGNLEKASSLIETGTNLMKELYESHPNDVEFKNGLAISYGNLGVFSLRQLNDKVKARTYFLKAQVLWSELVRDAPQYTQFQFYLKQVGQDLADLDQDPVVSLYSLLENEPDTLAKYRLYTTLCDTFRQRAQLDPTQKIALAEALNAKAWYGLFLQQFKTGESDIREGLRLHPENKYLPSNLAPALLLQGKKQAALAEYKKWKDKPFGEYDMPTYREMFLSDLDTLEKAGAIPKKRLKDVAAIRKMLTEK